MISQLLKFKEYLLIKKQRLTYYNYMGVFVNFLLKKNYTLDNINRDTILEFLKENEKWKASTINLFVHSGRSFYSFIFGDQKDNPFKTFKNIKVEQKINSYLSEEELIKGISYLIAESRLDEVKIKALLFFLVDTGLRVSELELLKREDINLTSDPAEALIRVPNKGKKERIVLITSSTVKLIIAYFNQEQEEFNAFNIRKHQIRYMLELLRKLYPLKKLSPHSLRHTSARMWDKKGTRLIAISQMLGHASTDTTGNYLRLSDDDIRKEFKKRMENNK